MKSSNSSEMSISSDRLPAYEKRLIVLSLTVCSVATVFGGYEDSRTDSAVFGGRLLLAISDVDMPASAYVDGKLKVGSRDGKEKDTLTIVRLPLTFSGIPDRDVEMSELDLPNSVIGSPFALAVSPDGGVAYVLETFGEAPEGVESVANVFDDFPRISVLRSVDISDPMNPKKIDELELGPGYHTVDVHPRGHLLAVCSDQPKEQIGLIGVENGEFGFFGRYALRGVEDESAQTGNIQWHPSGRFFAITLTMSDAVAFYALIGGRETEKPEIEPWGEQVKVGRFPYSGVWTPDGRHFITTDDQWGDDVPGFYIDPPPGELSVIRFESEEGDDRLEHRVVSKAESGISPEGIAVSPDGRLVATANLVRSFLPWDDSRLTQYSSMSLFDLNPLSGKIKHLADYRLQGILPESLVFDPTGESLAVAIYERFDPRDSRGAIEFWRILGTDPPSLEPSGYSISVKRGAHTLALVAN